MEGINKLTKDSKCPCCGSKKELKRLSCCPHKGKCQDCGAVWRVTEAEQSVKTLLELREKETDMFSCAFCEEPTHEDELETVDNLADPGGKSKICEGCFQRHVEKMNSIFQDRETEYQEEQETHRIQQRKNQDSHRETRGTDGF